MSTEEEVVAPNAEEAEARRGEVESEFAKRRNTLELEAIANRNILEGNHRKAMSDLEKERQEALVAVGLNPDGSDPQGRQQGSVV